MNLRPHHILCIQKFTGHGYDAMFTEHMKSVVSKLRNTQETEIVITQGCDELCSMCPHSIGDSCTSLEKVDRMDSSVLNNCDLTYGENVQWATLAHRARKRILETDVFYHVCSDCQWFELCKSTEGYHE